MVATAYKHEIPTVRREGWRFIGSPLAPPSVVDPVVSPVALSRTSRPVQGLRHYGEHRNHFAEGHSPNCVSFITDYSLGAALTLGHWIISETQNISGTWSTSFYGYDGHNSVRFLTDSAGAVTDNYTFDAFGIKIAGAGTTPNQILYSGEFLDPGTGNYGLRARAYGKQNGDAASLA